MPHRRPLLGTTFIKKNLIAGFSSTSSVFLALDSQSSGLCKSNHRNTESPSLFAHCPWLTQWKSVLKLLSVPRITLGTVISYSLLFHLFILRLCFGLFFFFGYYLNVNVDKFHGFWLNFFDFEMGFWCFWRSVLPEGSFDLGGEESSLQATPYQPR